MNNEQIIGELYKIRSEVDNLIMIINAPQEETISASTFESNNVSIKEEGAGEESITDQIAIEEANEENVEQDG